MTDIPQMKSHFRRFENANEMIGTLADEIVVRLLAGVRANGAASFVGSGGTTPCDLYDALATRDASWKNVTVALSDERWISPSEDGSNEKLLRSRLLRAKAASAHLVPMKTADSSPNDGEAKVSASIAAISRPFDVMLLGMGDDGHTASLFPNARGLEKALDVNDSAMARAVHTHDAAITGERMTLTLRAILDSKWIVVLIRGERKLATYRAAVAGTDILAMPIRAVFSLSRTPVEVFWSP